MVTIDNWSGVNCDPYMAPEVRVLRLRGNVTGHSEHEDGECIITSKIVGCDREKIITSSGSEYTLGRVDQRYEAIFPDARNRLIKILTK